MAEMTGYNVDRINDLYTPINNAAKNTAAGIIEILGTDVVTPMSQVWYMPSAKDFFDNFAEAVAGTADRITEIFEGFKQSVVEAGNLWGEAVTPSSGGYTVRTPEMGNIESVDMTLDTSAIQIYEPGTNNIYINEEGATKVANSLENTLESIKTRLNSVSKELDASTAFLGHNQSDKLEEYFGQVFEVVDQIFSLLMTGEDSLQSAITESVQYYNEFAAGMADAFAQGGSSTGTTE